MWKVSKSDPAHLELTYQIGRIIDDNSLGLHRSDTKGRGCEFLGLRPFQQDTDTAEDIDWLASARASEDDMELVVREFAPERQLRVIVVASEHPSMTHPRLKSLCADAVLRLFAYTAFVENYPFSVVSYGCGEQLLYSGWLSNEEDLDVFLASADDPSRRHSVRAPARTLEEFGSELDAKNTLVIFLSDLSLSDMVPIEQFRSIDTEGRNVRCVTVVLDEWSGFVPSSHLVPVRDPNTGRVAMMDMRPGGGFSREVDAFQGRLRELRRQGSGLGLKTLTVPLADGKPFRSFYKQWLQFAEDH